MRLPNGYGTVYKLSGKRRKPYIARITIGWEYDEKTEKKKQIVKTIGYFRTKKEGLQALADYNENPYDLSMSEITFAEMYELWAKEAYSTGTKSKSSNYKTAYKRCEPIYEMKMSELRPPILQQLLDNIENPTHDKVGRVKKLLNQVFKFCIKKDYLRYNHAENLEIKVKANREEKTPFSTAEIKYLWDNLNQSEYIKTILMLIYSGVRINELLNLKLEDINLERQYFYVRKSKTESGIRIVPIADKVFPFWKELFDNSKCEYLINNVHGEYLAYSNYHKQYWQPLMQRLGLNHTIHETRHTCITQLMQNGADKTIVKQIVGHKAVMNLTERVYTHIEIERLIETINLIP